MVQHTIELTTEGYRLVIWEPAVQTTNRVNPFIFKATYLTSSPSKAIEILNGQGKTESYHPLDRLQTN